ncbi:hypothetical protein EZY14_002220 [Kordia sp. TARA_039_SRF]|nr:hypothetical protein EZY14_002220 [Kordia sp. TARA_039_SRF]
MKVTFKILLLSGFLGVLSISCASLPESERKKEFIVLKTKDTIVADKLSAVNPFRNIGRVTITNNIQGKEITDVYTYDKIYQIHYFDRKNRPTVVEIIEETPSLSTTHVEMDIVINIGKVRLYKNDPGFRPDYPFVVSDFYHGYVRTKAEFESFINQLKKCTAFREKYTDERYFKSKNLPEIVTFYNENCDGK